MRVEIWVDPACPFCWITSRWLVAVAPERDLEIEWRSISLKVKNNTSPDSPFFDAVSRTHSMLRVFESMRAAGLADRIGDVYTAFGTRIHHEGNRDFDVAAVLGELGIDPEHADALDDEGFDLTIGASMREGLALVGNDVGTPIIAIDGKAGRVGLFGPVITTMPSPDDRLTLWDAFVALADLDGFFELKRTRTGGPDLSTITSA
jgi:hypothetical protein